MRLIVMFDLSMTTKAEIKEYTIFRKKLLNNGYIMMQYSVYSRFCRNKSDMHKHINRLKKDVPKNGEVRVLLITEHQYNNMLFLQGDFSNNEKTVTSHPLVIIDDD